MNIANRNDAQNHKIWNWNQPLKGSPPVSTSCLSSGGGHSILKSVCMWETRWRSTRLWLNCQMHELPGEIYWFCADSLEPDPQDQKRRDSHTIHLWSHFYCWCFCESLFLTTPRWWIKGLWLRRMHWCEAERRRGRLMGIERKMQGWWRSKVLFIESLYSHQSLLSSPVGLIFTLWDAAAEI